MLVAVRRLEQTRYGDAITYTPQDALDKRFISIPKETFVHLWACCKNHHDNESHQPHRRERQRTALQSRGRGHGNPEACFCFDAMDHWARAWYHIEERDIGPSGWQHAPTRDADCKSPKRQR
ncbi:hypothetical protein NHX12_001801 [Muraenolepis orangiensis]|uniref:Uncharacterized protein n=1 Tax=Muraenolepis orangiensis TaxID=630683 RepID=A0A9Q0E0D4_9TELE|nr:hypothetical protein NHX12_001801 [Muraenolepis orangiensis]